MFGFDQVRIDPEDRLPFLPQQQGINGPGAHGFLLKILLVGNPVQHHPDGYNTLYGDGSVNWIPDPGWQHSVVVGAFGDYWGNRRDIVVWNFMGFARD